jgi:hypothetical protein
MGQTCGPDQLITFSFFTARAFDPSAMTLADLEVVGLSDGIPSEPCIDASSCVITPRAPITATPEPATLTLVATGLVGIAGIGLRRRTGTATRSAAASED